MKLLTVKDATRVLKNIRKNNPAHSRIRRSSVTEDLRAHNRIKEEDPALVVHHQGRTGQRIYGHITGLRRRISKKILIIPVQTEC
jgi:hypothetical protein